ncbi:MAG: hypothetical protein NTX25_14575 [Proteobacteria bacterium]|nr:hypothetical protein [Pseudomonadota bacterium]
MRRGILSGVLAFCLLATKSYAYTANKVDFEFMQTGHYRVTVNYTIPELKEFREAYVLFTKKKEAEQFYWKLVRGADFYPDNPLLVRFMPTKLQPTPW